MGEVLQDRPDYVITGRQERIGNDFRHQRGSGERSKRRQGGVSAGLLAEQHQALGD
jgi:hypothetical protein